MSPPIPYLKTRAAPQSRQARGPPCPDSRADRRRCQLVGRHWGCLCFTPMEAPLNILCIQNDAIGPAGLIGEQIFRRNGNLDVVMPHDGDAMPGDHAAYDGVLVLGGAMDAFDDENYPQFWPMIRLLRGFHAAGKPILGVCLGAQLVARVFDKPVYRHHELELGFTEVE